jgi:hypothetical protein
MDLYLDSFRGPEQGYLYSIGEDKAFNAYNMSEKKLVQNINVAKSRPTVMTVDGPRGVLYVATRKGGVVVFDLSTLEVKNFEIFWLILLEKQHDRQKTRGPNAYKRKNQGYGGKLG